MSVFYSPPPDSSQTFNECYFTNVYLYKYNCVDKILRHCQQNTLNAQTEFRLGKFLTLYPLGIVRPVYRTGVSLLSIERFLYI